MGKEEERIALSVELFKSGYNCSQAVVAAFADLYGVSREDALRISASFGAGIGRMRETCGAACGLFILAGLKFGTTEAKNTEAKAENYRIVQDLAEQFRKENGFLKCRDLLGLSEEKKESYKPEERTQQYYERRPCAKIVEEAARLWYINYVK